MTTPAYHDYHDLRVERVRTNTPIVRTNGPFQVDNELVWTCSCGWTLTQRQETPRPH